MKVMLVTGKEIELLGPVVEERQDGIFISFREMNARIDGRMATIGVEALEDAQFPPECEAWAGKVFDSTLDGARANWDKLKKREVR